MHDLRAIADRLQRALPEMTAPEAIEAVQETIRTTEKAILEIGKVLGELPAEVLPFAERSDNLEGKAMTAAQTLRRGAAIAKAHADKTGDVFQQAVTSSKWRSQARYAKERLGISPSTLSEYRKGIYPTPRKIAEKAAKDLDIPADQTNWPGGLVD